MKTAGLDHTGDLMMEHTEASDAAKVTPEAKCYKKPAMDKGKGSAKENTGAWSSTGGHPARKTRAETSGEPKNLPVAAVLRFEKIERAQQLQDEAIEAQGKSPVSLETKVSDTSTQVGSVGSNVKQMLRAQQEQTIKNNREWHNVGEINVVGRRRLTASVKKQKNWYGVLHHCAGRLRLPVHSTPGSCARHGRTLGVLETHGRRNGGLQC